MTSPTVLYLGTETGVVVLRSEDNCKWEVQSESLRGWAIPKLTADPSWPNRVVAGTRGDGVWVSEDFGQSWKKPSYGHLSPGKVRSIILDPNAPGTLYAGTEPIDVWVSHDVGKRWTRLDSVWKLPWVESVMYPGRGVEPHVRDIAIDPKRPGTMYVALQVGYIIKSTDGGESWKLLDKDLDDDVHTIVIHPTSTDQLFAATGGHVQNRAIYKSTDAGESWTLAIGADFSSQRYSVPLVMHPKDPNVLYSALANGSPGGWRRPTGAESAIVRTKDGAVSWERLEKGLEETHGIYAEAIVIDHDNPDRLYVGFRKGSSTKRESGEIYTSEDGGDSWARLDIRVSSVNDLRCIHP